MIRATEVRIVGLGVVLAASLVAASGCQPASSGSGKAPPNLNITGPGPKNGNKPQLTRPPAVEYLGSFFQALAKAPANPDSFSSAFKEKVARPKFQNTDHEKLGYDPDKLNAYLDKALPKTLDGIEAIPVASGSCFASMGKIAGRAENCLIRLVPTDDATGWRIDWVQRTATIAPPFRDAGLEPYQTEARIAAIAFLATLFDGQFDLAEAMMSKAYKSDLAFSTADSYKKLGYDSALLQQLKLRTWKGNFVEFSIAKQTIEEGKPAVITGEMVDAGMINRKPFTLTLIKEANGEWLVDKFEVK